MVISRSRKHPPNAPKPAKRAVPKRPKLRAAHELTPRERRDRIAREQRSPLSCDRTLLERKDFGDHGSIEGARLHAKHAQLAQRGFGRVAKKLKITVPELMLARSAQPKEFRRALDNLADRYRPEYEAVARELSRRAVIQIQAAKKRKRK